MPPAQARAFLDKHNVGKILGEAVNAMVAEQAPDPAAFLSNYFSNLAARPKPTEAPDATEPGAA